uniref:Si:dkey-266m15.6 n=1 Tax=Cyprinus carpio TaxID=7962 RepID=A0A8C2HYC0_CYPCA
MYSIYIYFINLSILCVDHTLTKISATNVSCCIYDGVQHLEGSTWFASSSPCMSCMCVNGVTTCSEVHCLSTCLNQISVPGECCPVCAGTTTVQSLQTVLCMHSFALKVLSLKCVFFFCQTVCMKQHYFKKRCKKCSLYVHSLNRHLCLCSSVHVSNEDRGRKGVSWTKEVTVFIGDIVVQLFQNWIVKVICFTMLFKLLHCLLSIWYCTFLNVYIVYLNVSWNGRSHLEVSVPGTYKKQMCGLCGNFNNYPHDDMKLRNGQITNSEAVFGNSWKVETVQCPDAININPCTEAGYSAHKTANARCAVLKSPVFERCHKLVPPEMFYASCVYDQCACGSNVDECLCDVLEAYASECRKAGVILQWRSPTLCAVGCPLDRGYVFDECGPPCPKTCFNKDVPLGVIEAHCFKPCVPGCQCPAGLVEHNSHCIAPEKCPKIIHGNL